VVDVVGARQSRLGRGRRGLVVEVVGARLSRSGRGRRGLVDVVGAQRRRSRAGVVGASRSRSLCSRPSTKSRAQRRDMSLLVG